MPMRPAVATLIFAALTAAAVAVSAAVPFPLHRSARVNAALILGLIAYAVYLCRLSRRPPQSLCGPLLVSAAAAVAAGSVFAFALPAAAALSWARSGICCRAPRWRRWVMEPLAVGGGLLLADLLCDLRPGPYTWAAGVWGFGLAQAVFAALCDEEAVPDTSPRPEPARAHRRADALLREKKLEKAFQELGL